MGKFGHWSCVFFIAFDWFTVIMHWTQCWCRWESYESSVSWFSSLKNAERPKLFQKSQFCFFHWLVWLFTISVKHLRQSCFISEAYAGITKFSFFQNHQTCIFLQVWASNLHCNRLQFWATISRLSVLLHDLHLLYYRLLFFGEQPNQTTLRFSAFKISKKLGFFIFFLILSTSFTFVKPISDPFQCLFFQKIPEYSECLKYHTFCYYGHALACFLSITMHLQFDSEATCTERSVNVAKHQNTQNFEKKITHFLLYGQFRPCFCVCLINYNPFIVWFPVNMHWRQHWCR